MIVEELKQALRQNEISLSRARNNLRLAVEEEYIFKSRKQELEAAIKKLES